MGPQLKRSAANAAGLVVALLAACCVTQGAWAAEPGHAGHAGHKRADKSIPGVISLDVCADGARLHLLVAERPTGGGSPAMSYLRSDDGGATWAAPVPVGSGQPAPEPAKRGMDAQVAAAGDRLVAMWTTGAETRFGRGPLATAVSADGGRTWTPGPNPSDDGLETDHAYADVVADADGNFHAVWLDARSRGEGQAPKGEAGLNSGNGAGPTGGSRNGSDADGSRAASAGVAGVAKAGGAAPGPTSGSEGAAKGLRYARSTDGGRSWSANLTLDPQCCECCWNSLLALPGGGVHVLYRDRDPRDMALVRSADGGRTWDPPVPVGAFAWDFTGCPHVGGALAGSPDGRTLSAVVWTAKGGDAVGAFALSSADAGRTWSTPSRLGGEQSSRPDVAADAAGRHVVAAWDEYLDEAGNGSNAAFTAVSHDAGRTWSSPQRISQPGTSSTHPRVVRVPDGFRVFWTQKAAGKPTTWESRKLDD